MLGNHSKVKTLSGSVLWLLTYMVFNRSAYYFISWHLHVFNKYSMRYELYIFKLIMYCYKENVNNCRWIGYESHYINKKYTMTIYLQAHISAVVGCQKVYPFWNTHTIIVHFSFVFDRNIFDRDMTFHRFDRQLSSIYSYPHSEALCARCKHRKILVTC